jgi:hypothetical protein
MLRNRIARLFILLFLVFPAGMALPVSGAPAPGPGSAVSVNAQDPATAGQASPQVKESPADAATALYRVMGVILLIWFGLAAFLFNLDRRVAKLEKTSPDMK